MSSMVSQRHRRDKDYEDPEEGVRSCKSPEMSVAGRATGKGMTISRVASWGRFVVMIRSRSFGGR